MLFIVLPKPVVTVLITSPTGIASSAIRIAEIIRDGNACSLVKIIKTSMTIIPIAIANTGFSMFFPPLCFLVWILYCSHLFLR